MRLFPAVERRERRCSHARDIERAIGRSRFHIAADRFLLAAMESPPDGDWRERLWLKRDLRRHEVLLNELIARKAEAEIRWKQVRPSARYVWRTRGDEKVRTSHRPNDGRIFSWSEPPETGHPGEDYNCRCSAEPYVRAETGLTESGRPLYLLVFASSSSAKWYPLGGMMR